MTWLREIRWPFPAAILDGEAVAGDESEGIQAVFGARNRPDGAMAFVAFDVLELDGRSVARALDVAAQAPGGPPLRRRRWAYAWCL